VGVLLEVDTSSLTSAVCVGSDLRRGHVTISKGRYHLGCWDQGVLRSLPSHDHRCTAPQSLPWQTSLSFKHAQVLPPNASAITEPLVISDRPAAALPCICVFAKTPPCGFVDGFRHTTKSTGRLFVRVGGVTDSRLRTLRGPDSHARNGLAHKRR
jgi:hypothetical protein